VAGARDRGREVAQVREEEHGLEAAAVGLLAQRDRAVAPWQSQAAAVGLAVVGLDAGDRARAEEVEQGARGERAPAGQADPDRRHGRPLRGPRAAAAAPQLAGGPREDRADGVVELAQAREAGAEGDLRDRQVRRLEQDPRRLRALRPRERERTRAHLRRQHAVQRSLRVGHAPGEAGHALAVYDAVEDQAHRARGDVGAPEPLGRAGSGVRAAAQAGAKAGLLGRRGGRVKAHVLALGRDRGAARPAVDAGRGDRREEPAVEARVAAAQGAVGGLEVDDHGPHPRKPRRPSRAGFGRARRRAAWDHRRLDATVPRAARLPPRRSRRERARGEPVDRARGRAGR